MEAKLCEKISFEMEGWLSRMCKKNCCCILKPPKIEKKLKLQMRSWPTLCHCEFQKLTNERRSKRRWAFQKKRDHLERKSLLMFQQQQQRWINGGGQLKTFALSLSLVLSLSLTHTCTQTSTHFSISLSVSSFFSITLTLSFSHTSTHSLSISHSLYSCLLLMSCFLFLHLSRETNHF